MSQPEIVVQSDFDGYFERLVQSWIDMQDTRRFKHSKIVISAGPWRSCYVYIESKDGELHLDFYSAIRMGFGHISDAEVMQIVNML